MGHVFVHVELARGELSVIGGRGGGVEGGVALKPAVVVVVVRPPAAAHPRAWLSFPLPTLQSCVVVLR